MKDSPASLEPGVTNAHVLQQRVDEDERDVQGEDREDPGVASSPDVVRQ